MSFRFKSPPVKKGDVERIKSETIVKIEATNASKQDKKFVAECVQHSDMTNLSLFFFQHFLFTTNVRKIDRIMSLWNCLHDRQREWLQHLLGFTPNQFTPSNGS